VTAGAAYRRIGVSGVARSQKAQVQRAGPPSRILATKGRAPFDAQPLSHARKRLPELPRRSRRSALPAMFAETRSRRDPASSETELSKIEVSGNRKAQI
jgi:hypothetical protein